MEYKTFLKNAKDEYTETLIDAISELFLNHNMQDMKMTDIADELGIGVATLYRYFKTKKNIVIQCGIHLWRKEISLFEGVFESEMFHAKSGIEQIEDLLKFYIVLYKGHRPFLKFLCDFDFFVTAEHVTKEELKEYEASIMNVYPLLKASYEKGCKDGSIKRTVDFDEFYFTTSHAMMVLSQKVLPEGLLLSSDYIVEGEKQLNLLIAMVLNYLEGGNK